MHHHTKDKGDTGLGYVIADCMANAVQIALPISEHQPFDCIAINECGKMCRLSVKYRKADASGGIHVNLESSWSDAHGIHKRAVDHAAFDAVAVYCPQTHSCYYVRTTEFRANIFSLRITPPKNKQQFGVRLADGYTNPTRIFDQ